MSFLSSIKKLVFGPPRVVEAPKTATPHPGPSASRVPKVSRPLKVPATTDEDIVDVPRNATEIAPGVVCDVLSAKGTKLKELPDETTVRVRLDLTASSELTSIPPNIRTGSLRLSGCPKLTALPEGLEVVFLDLSSCRQIEELPSDLKLRGGGLYLRGCTGLTGLPDGMGEVAGLDLAGCTGLTALPDGLTVTSWMDITGTGITEIPPSFQNAGLRRKGKPVTFEDAHS